jgi:nucleoside-diphosphate-sugar epimerase
MRVFVAGATGVLGRRAVARLVAAGHQVTAVARTPEKAAQVARLGASPVEVSLFDPGALRHAVAGHDAVCNLATHIPPVREASRPEAWAENTRIRAEGSRHLVDAAVAAGARVYVQESIAFVYGEHGDGVIDAASTPLGDTPFTADVRVAESQAARFAEHGGRGVVLRFGMFWAPDASHTESIVAMARRGLSGLFVRDDGYQPMVDVDDAADAVVHALDAPSGTYDIVADPVPRREVNVALASAVGRRRLRRPFPMATLRRKAPHYTWSQRVSGRRFTEATGWRPASRTAADVVTRVVAASGAERSLPGAARFWLWALALTGLQIGVHAQFFPRAFYEQFPLGREWVATDGPYNEHLIRDFGAMNLALFVVAIAAILTASRAVARVAAAGWLVFAVPHFVYHLRHLEHYDTADQIGNVVTLTFTVVAPLLALVSLGRKRSDGADSGPAVVLDDISTVRRHASTVAG